MAAVTSNSNHRDEGREEVCDQDIQVTSSAEHLYTLCQVLFTTLTVCIFTFVVAGQRVNTRNIPYTLRSLDMSDEDMDTLIDGQSTGKSAKDQKRDKSKERSRKAPAEMQFHTPGPPQKEKNPRATTT